MVAAAFYFLKHGSGQTISVLGFYYDSDDCVLPGGMWVERLLLHRSSVDHVHVGWLGKIRLRGVSVFSLACPACFAGS